MGRQRSLHLDPADYPLAEDAEILGPRWLAALSVYWRGQGREQARQVLDLVDAATREPTAERSVYLLLKALRLLGLVEVSIIRLVLDRYVHFVQAGQPDPARHMAAEVLATLLAIETGRRPARSAQAVTGS